MMDPDKDSKTGNATRHEGKALRLAVVAPCYNEEEMLPLSVPRLRALMERMKAEGIVTEDSFILLVNDGSRDRTWALIEQYHAETPGLVHGLDLARNVGHQNAIMAGMERAVASPLAADAVVTIDADLQDDPECIPRMVRDCLEGYDVVYGVRSSRESDSFMKRFTAESFYKLQARLGLKTIYNHADFRLMTRRVVLELERYGERNLYLRGIIPLIGYPSSRVEEVRAAREAGETKYTVKKMLTLAFDGITSFSVKPIYMILGLGAAFILIAVAIGIWVIAALATGSAVHGWSSTMLSIWLVGGINLIATGLVGLYVGKVYIETKQRPRYHIKELL